MTYQELLGWPVAEAIQFEAKKQIEQLQKRGINPTLATIRVGEQKPSIAYEKSATKQLSKLGIEVENYVYAENITEDEFLKKLDIIGDQSEIHGILIMQPLPSQIDLGKVARQIPPQKDVDGMHPLNLGLLLCDDDHALIPSTAKAVMSLIDFYEIPVAHQNICVIGKSNAVGKPITNLLLNRHGTVSNCHTRTRDLALYTKEADIIICAAGSKHLITKDMVKEGVIIIDIGYNVEAGKVYGDADYEGIGDKASAMTPVPKGVGAVTTTSLAEQVIQATWQQIDRHNES